MAIDTPARIAVLGAGPIGLEAALYGRYLGYDVDVYERGGVARNLLDWGHVRLFTAFGGNRTALALAALAAQDPAWRPPDDDALLTGREHAERYLLPLARSDLLEGSIHEQTRVVAVGRTEWMKGDLVGDESRGDDLFRILLDSGGQERTAEADVVIDATGTYGSHNWLGRGGIPAVGERALADRIEYGLPDILGRDRASYAGRRVLVVGSGYSAATNIVLLAELAAQSPGTQITWITRRPPEPADGPTGGPVRLVPGDRLSERERMAKAANALAASGGAVQHRSGTMVDGVEWQADKDSFLVHLSHDGPAETVEVNRIIANVGYRPDNSLFSELQVHECYATSGPMKLAAQLAAHPSRDCLDQPPSSASALLNPEPNFYILGAKSYGRNSNFLLSTGFDQVRQVFSIVADRADLDLDATAGKPRS
ncbi:MAG: hypothetical protein WD403_12155 [Pirellulales bacterium]